MQEMRTAHRILTRNLKGRDYSEEIGVDGRIILVWVIGK
jgi:hypothetical protein